MSKSIKIHISPLLRIGDCAAASDGESTEIKSRDNMGR